MEYLVYILRCGDGSLYTGCTNDLPRRLRAHQSGLKVNRNLHKSRKNSKEHK